MGQLSIGMESIISFKSTAFLRGKLQVEEV